MKCITGRTLMAIYKYNDALNGIEIYFDRSRMAKNNNLYGSSGFTQAHINPVSQTGFTRQ